MCVRYIINSSVFSQCRNRLVFFSNFLIRRVVQSLLGAS